MKFTEVFRKIVFKSSKLAKSAVFNQTILFFILFAAILVGVQSYDSLEDNAVVVVFDWIILTVFTLEVVVKVLAEGNKPWRYFTGSERAWNTFDFSIVLFCLPIIPVNSSSIAFLRLMRLLRVTKLFNRIPELQIIVLGLILGLKSIVYVLLLLLLAFYLFAVLAVFLFRENDPGDFGDLAITIISLFRCSTLDDWTDLMYVNMLGCDVYDLGLYTEGNATERFQTRLGSFTEFTCAHPRGQWATSALFFVSFTVISAFVVLSLFIGAITLSMSEVLDDQHRERRKAKIAAVVSPEWLWDTINKALGDQKIDGSDFVGSSHSGQHSPPLLPLSGRSAKVACGGGARVDLSKTYSSLGVSALSASTRGMPFRQNWRKALWYKYLRVSLTCRRITHSPKFKTFMIGSTALAGIVVGISTASKAAWIPVADNIILGIFTAEVILKILAQGRKPWRYFTDPWNRFDCTVVVCSFMPILLGAGMGAQIAVVRLLRVLKVLQAFKQLKIVVEALLKGFQSISYISVVMLVLFFMFAIVGMILFKKNDPWHFGLLQDAMLTLFRCATLEDWTDIMYINMWGCDRYGYGDFPELCTNPVAWGWLSTAYFVIFAVVGSMVLVTLFLGVVTTSMENAAMRQKIEEDLQEEIKLAVNKHRITDYGVRLLYNAFSLLDADEGGTLEYDELKPMLACVSPDFNEKTFRLIFNKVDADKSGEVDLAEFIHLAILIKEWSIDQQEAVTAKEDTLEQQQQQQNEGLLQKMGRRGSLAVGLLAKRA
eukprot:CAMPEP_0117860898 /NCGR_PEP_ID=MMETSP0950-20121206/4059_1 /TAXON_ID=44440 /ORGANISM="Chattonella subsalsa, Strain CCMP2191" /LENGTH=768 /DNA_ID=CAMNT_0005711163 /DNA_START=165 /DNA_END=2467 /DNA_ORIENTATION=+